MNYLYKGFLSEKTVNYLKKAGNEGYVYWAEMGPVPSLFPWADKNLKKYSSKGEDCMGQDYIKKTPKVVVVDFKFVGFVCIEDRDKFTDHFSAVLVTKDPFSTTWEED